MHEIFGPCSPYGGEDVIVEFTNQKFGKRNQNRCYYIEGVCVVCIVERTDIANHFHVNETQLLRHIVAIFKVIC